MRAQTVAPRDFTEASYVRRLDDPRDPLSAELVPACRLRAGDAVLCTAGDVVPAPGVVLDGVATTRAPDGGDATLDPRGGAHVAVGMRLACGWLVIRLDEAPR